MNHLWPQAMNITIRHTKTRPRRQDEFIELAQPWPKVDEGIPKDGRLQARWGEKFLADQSLRWKSGYISASDITDLTADGW